MSRRNGKRQWLIAVVGLLAALLVFGGTALAGKKKASRDEGWLGVYIQEVDEDIQETRDLASADGVIIEEVIDGSPADKAGLEPDDVILMYDGNPVTSSNRFTRMIRRTAPETEVKLQILRDGKPQDITVTIGESRRNNGYYFSDEDDDYYFSHGSPHVIIPPVRVPKIDIPRIEVIDDDLDCIYLGGAGGHLGLQLRGLNDQLAKYFGLMNGEGILVEKVLKDSPAEKAGIKAGDVILSVNGEDMGDVDDVIDEIRDYDEGDTVEVAVMRDREKKIFPVTIEEDDDDYAGDHFLNKSKYRSRSYRPRTAVWHNDLKDTYRDINDELEEAVEELREELEEVHEELKEALEELEGR
jgi:serine protease Do